MRILIAEDNDSSRDMLVALLVKWGYQVVATTDGRKALEVLRKPGAPKLVLLDWMMQGMDGIEVCRRIRKTDTIEPPYIIILSARDRKEDIVKGLDTGANDYITKPFDSEELRARVEAGRRAVEFQGALVKGPQKQARQAAISQKKQVSESEESLGKAGKEDVPARSSETATRIFDQIVVVFKRGEIDLPSHPQISTRFNELVNKGANLHEIAYLLRQDVAISSKLIAVSNSAYYRGATENRTLEHAVGRLGFATTKQYVDAICNRGLYMTKDSRFLKYMEKLWEHSLACAYASQAVSKALRLQLPDDVFTLGLMHDIGKLLLLQAVGELQKRNKLAKDVDRADVFNTIEAHHGRFGGALLKKWSFSDTFVQVAIHHDHLENAASVSKEILVVNLANLVVKSIGYDPGGQSEIDLEGSESARLLKMEPKGIAEVKGHTEQMMEEMKGHLS
jgi:DNA-binding response OmpR family regulator